jgi:hypothetical protein
VTVTPPVIHLIDVATKLIKPYESRFKRFQSRTNEYAKVCVPVLGNNHGETRLKSISNPDVTPRIFLAFADRCNCQERVAEEDMCVHEILAKNGYHEIFYNEMHFRRDFVSGSMHGWVPPMDTVINDCIGYIHERINDSDDDMAISVHDDDGVVANPDGAVGNADSTTLQADK